MSDSVGIVTPNQTPPSQTQGNANAPASTQQSSADSFAVQTAQNQQNQNPQTPAVGVNDSSAPISPRIVVDPLAGPITEFLSANGQIQAQTPSAAVVAYLRAGLTSSGLPPTTVEQTPKPEKTNSDTGTNTNGSDKSSVVA